jgi:mannosylglycerate hydrolase
MQPLDVCVVPHTHWDREWYHVAPRFRQALVALIDTILAAPDSGDSEAGQPPAPFLLDGQAITLRDYLAVRPAQVKRLRQALAQGAIEAGPWFVLADNLIPSGEALVRNLEAGRRVLAEFGASAPAVAYCPDTFGHPAALPLVAAGFGLPVAVVWRGAGGAAHPHGDAFWWQGPDGSRVLTHHLPPDGYEFGSALPTGREAARARWARLAELWRVRNRTGVALLLNGADHHARQPDLDAALIAMRDVAGSAAALRHTSLAAWARTFRVRGAKVPLPTVTGELRDSYGYTWTLGGTLGTRAAQKRHNARLECGLLRDVEPWLALVRLHDRAGHAAMVSDAARLSMAQLPTLLDRAWEDLLATHPHDTLCGCSIDAVARAMDVQQELVAAQGVGLREAALQLALGHDPVAARARQDFDWHRVVVRNRATRRRGGVAVLQLRETLRDVPVGPASAGGSAPQPAENAGDAVPPVLSTGAWLSQPLGARLRHQRRESPQHYPDNDLVREERWLVWVPPVPAAGVAVHDARTLGVHTAAPSWPVAVHEDEYGVTIDNGRLRLQLDHSHEPTLSLQVDDRTLPDVLALETQRDVGDSYTPALRGTAERLRCVRARVVARGPLRATVRLHWRTSASGATRGPQGPITVVTDVSLDAEAAVVQCMVRGTVRRTDQRLQLVWQTDVHAAAVWADAAFGPVRRVLPVAPAESREAVVPTMPMHRWAMQVNAMFGATMIADGLAEAELRDGRLALTLVRGVGELSRATLDERPGHAGWPSPIPAAQSQGPFIARTALFLHGPMCDDTRGRVRDVCDDVLLPLVGETWRDLDAVAAPATLSGPSLQGEAFEASAVTVARHDERAVILRAVNLTTRAAQGAWHLPDDGPWHVTRCRLDETAEAEPMVTGAAVPLEAGPREVITLRVRRAP